MRRTRSLVSQSSHDRRSDDRGVTLIVVMVVMAVVLLLGTTLASSSIFHLPMAVQQNEREQALEAAQSGIADFTSYLNNDANYWHDAAAMNANPAFTQWVKVPGDPNDESFRYHVDSSTIAQGYLTLEASGCASPSFSATTCTSGVVRTVQVQLKPEGFTDYVYFTNNELANPATTPGTTCHPYLAWQANGVNNGIAHDEYGPTGNCSQELGTWGTGTVFDGPVHTNDAFRFCGNPEFTGEVDSYFANAPSGSAPDATAGLGGSTQSYLQGWVNNKFQRSNCGTTSTPIFKAGPIAAGYNLPMPATNANLASLVDKAQGGTDGCLFSGYTALSLYYVGSQGYISYSSPYTDFGGSSWNSSVCGTPSSGTTGTIKIPASGLVVYVQAATTATTTSGQAKSCLSEPQVGQGPDQCGGDVTIGDAPVGATNQFPIALQAASNVAAPPSPPAGATGGLAGQLTVASADGIQIDNNLEYRTAPPQPSGTPSGGSVSTDMLGLIAQNDIMLDHDPTNASAACGWSDNTSTQDFCENPVIDGALLSIQGAFYVQNWGSGGVLGNVTFNGSLALDYSGITGTAYSDGTLISGFNEKFEYDPRLAFSSPPYFLSPSTTYWVQRHWTELPACATPGTGC